MAEIPNRSQLEAIFAARFSELSSRHRQRLLELVGDPPNPALVPESFWEFVRQETESELAAILVILFAASFDYHTPAGANTNGPFEAAAYADRRAREIADGYARHSRDRWTTFAQNWRPDLGAEGGSAEAPGPTGPTPGSGPSRPGGGETRPTADARRAVEDAAATIFGPERAESVATTETTAAQSAGAESAASAAGVLSDRDIWWTEADGRVCRTCGPLHRTGRRVWSQKFPDGPPAHPNCRCWIEYAFQADARRTGNLFGNS